MRGLTIFFIFHGLANIIVSIENIISGRPVEFLSITMNQNINIVGIVLGMLFIIAGVGMEFKTRYSFYISLFLITFFCLYLLVEIVYLINLKVFGITVIVFIIFLIYALIGKYILNKKPLFNLKNM